MEAERRLWYLYGCTQVTVSRRVGCGANTGDLSQGCGRGYDVVLLALHGFDAYGLEVSTTAVETARKYAEKELERPSEENFGSSNEDERKRWSDDRGCVKVLLGDFFKSRWTSEEPEDQLPEKWDLVYDYTVRL
jgi:methyl halide transferase